ncbi:hypothetical protein DTL21_07185 [Bremerella cremea]|uniref:Uncharacterized protein n=1 Tax=Blastopirellula marina TaxID=124 RepID=A0A2S8FZV0_9BACT|nr:hypothetical protein C5Y83_07185 [Blastopirellula marina]RCS50109.1 hypothetical protein DTL21_07185 [Bremerella cremea]
MVGTCDLIEERVVATCIIAASVARGTPSSSKLHLLASSPLGGRKWGGNVAANASLRRLKALVKAKELNHAQLG